MARHFVDIWLAETSKLFSRFTAKMGLILAALLGVLGPVFLWIAMNADMTWNGAQVAESIDATSPLALQIGLELRNFFILRAFVIVLAALSFAAEYRAQTIREDLIRPVPRWMVPVSKWLAVNTWIAATLLVAWVFGGLLAVVVFGFDGEWMRPLSGYGVTFLADAGFASLVLLVAVASRSVAGTVAGVLLFLVLDTMLGWALTLISWASELFAGMGLQLSETMERAVALQPWLPSSAFGVWSGYAARTDWDWRSFVSLAVLTVTCVVLSERVFNRLDVP
ncbi:MAG: ABC transporter permease [Deltaproteobacteria bacterium]|nr:ABC transporter permease [Deltaproteobacteria bacterium]